MNRQANLWLTTSIFTVTYAGLAIGRLPGSRADRAAIAFAGAAAMLTAGLLSLAEATSADSIDYQTLFLLLGMMIVCRFSPHQRGHRSAGERRAWAGFIAAGAVGGCRFA